MTNLFIQPEFEILAAIAGAALFAMFAASYFYNRF